jgi:hypothetical protein
MISTNKICGFSLLRRSTRRGLVVTYWCAMLLCSFAFLGHENFTAIGALLALQMLFLLPQVLGGVRTGGIVKPFRGVHFVPLQERDDVQTLFPAADSSSSYSQAALDERETHERDHVHFIAYTLVRWLALPLFAVYGLFAFIWPAVLSEIGPLFFFVLTVTLWSLPQSLILWTEPDMEEPQ